MDELAYSYSIIARAKQYQTMHFIPFEQALALAIGYTQYAATKGFI